MRGKNERGARGMSPVIGTILLVGVIGCGDLFGGNDFALTVSFSDEQVAADAPVRITVTAMNLGDPVVWGQGSSSCQLGAVVRVGSDDYPTDIGRGCTEDLVPQGLGRGESRTEWWEWNGVVVNGIALDTLMPGSYEIRGLAGDLERSARRTIQVVAPGQ
ncbi:MAG: hypothetical protein OER90_05500 [Gemmatimonadota bacterium]|nr:hypothetical protein [Gemmatimonadota bacterium]